MATATGLVATGGGHVLRSAIRSSSSAKTKRGRRSSFRSSARPRAARVAVAVVASSSSSSSSSSFEPFGEKIVFEPVTYDFHTSREDVIVRDRSGRVVRKIRGGNASGAAFAFKASSERAPAPAPAPASSPPAPASSAPKPAYADGGEARLAELKSKLGWVQSGLDAVTRAADFAVNGAPRAPPSVEPVSNEAQAWIDAWSAGKGDAPYGDPGAVTAAGAGGGGKANANANAAETSGAFYTLVPIRPRRRGERRSLRTFAVVSLRPPLAFNPRPRRLSTPLLTPFNSTPTFACIERPSSSSSSSSKDLFDRVDLAAFAGEASRAKTSFDPTQATCDEEDQEAMESALGFGGGASFEAAVSDDAAAVSTTAATTAAGGEKKFALDEMDVAAFGADAAAKTSFDPTAATCDEDDQEAMESVLNLAGGKSFEAAVNDSEAAPAVSAAALSLDQIAFGTPPSDVPWRASPDGVDDVDDETMRTDDEADQEAMEDVLNFAASHPSCQIDQADVTAPKTHEKPVIAKSHKAAFFDLDGTIANSNVVAQYVVAKCDQMTTFWKCLWLPLYALKCAFYLVVDWLRCVLYKRTIFHPSLGFNI